MITKEDPRWESVKEIDLKIKKLLTEHGVVPQHISKFTPLEDICLNI